MHLSRFPRLSLPTALAAALIMSLPAAAATVASLDEAKALAAEKDLLIVLDFGTDW